MADPAPPRTRRVVWAGVALAAAVIAAHALSLGGDFTNWDDDWLIVRNPWIQQHDLASVATILDPTVGPATREQLGAEYLPLRDLSAMADHAFFGLDPVGHHLTNLLLHLLGTLALGAATWRFTGRAALALGCAVTFGLHPVQAESVQWLSSRKDVLAGLCGALAALAWTSARVRAPGSGRSGFALRYGLSIVLCGAACLSKYTAVVWPALLMVAEWFAPPAPGDSRSPARRVAWLLPHLALVAIFTLTIAVPIGSRALIRSYYGTGFGSTLLTVSAVVAAYAWRLVLPARLQAAVDFPLVGEESPGLGFLALAGVTLAALVAVAGVWRARRDPAACPPAWRAVAAGIALFAVALAPTSNLAAPIGTLFAERYLYLPVMGVGVMAGALLQGALAAAGVAGRRAVIAMACLLAAGWGVRTAARAPVWDGSERLWTDVLAQDPGHHTALFNLGLHHFERALAADGPARRAGLVRAQGHLESALRYTHRSFQTRPERAATALGTVLTGLDQLPEALAAYDRALALAAATTNALPAGRAREAQEMFVAEILANRSQALDKAGRRADARADLTEALRLRPDSATAHLNLGLVLARDLARDDAPRRALVIEHLESAASLDPRGIEPLLNLAILENESGDARAALRRLDEALRRDPASTDARYYRGVVVLQLGQEAEAREIFEGLYAEPGVSARGAGALGLGTLHEQGGRYRTAEQVWLTALRDPLLKDSARAASIRGALGTLYHRLASGILPRGEREQALTFLEAAAAQDAPGARPEGVALALALGRDRLVTAREGPPQPEEREPPELQEAQRFFVRAARLDPECVDAYLALAEVARERGDGAALQAALNEALAVRGAPPATLARARREGAKFEAGLAFLLWKAGKGDLAKTREALARGAALAPDEFSVWRVALQVEAGEGGDLDRALDAAARLSADAAGLSGNDRRGLVRAHSRAAVVAGKRDDAAARTHHLEAAIGHQRALVEREPKSGEHRANLAALWKMARRLDLAVVELEAALAANPADAGLRAQVAETHRALGLRAYAAGRRPEARTHLERADVLAGTPAGAPARLLEALRAGSEAETAAAAEVAEGRRLLAAGNAAEAAERGKVARLRHASRAATLLVADAWFAMGRHDDAAAGYREALDEWLDDGVLERLGEALWLDGRWDEAVDTVAVRLAGLPEGAAAPEAEAWLDARRGRLATEALAAGRRALANARAGGAEADAAFGTARAALRRAVRHRSDDARAWLDLALAAEGAGEREEARTAATKARDLAAGASPPLADLVAEADTVVARLGG